MPIKILIIEDEIGTRLILRALLEKEGYVVQEAEDGVKGLAVVAEGGVDLVLLDVMMPKMDGWQVCKTLKQNSKTQDIPVIALTGRDRPIDELQGFESGVNAYLRKPVDHNQLVAEVRRILMEREEYT